jgi:hypothetical protein
LCLKERLTRQGAALAGMTRPVVLRGPASGVRAGRSGLKTRRRARLLPRLQNAETRGDIHKAIEPRRDGGARSYASEAHPARFNTGEHPVTMKPPAPRRPRPAG